MLNKYQDQIAKALKLPLDSNLAAGFGKLLETAEEAKKGKIQAVVKPATKAEISSKQKQKDA